MTLVAIHQPTFLPYLGWWDKFARCDVFVLLDDVQYPKKGGSWMNRVKLLVSGAPAWVTVPVDRSYHGVRVVREMRIDETTLWRRRLARTFSTSYGGAPHYADAEELLDAILAAETSLLADLNARAIGLAAERLGLGGRRVVRQSELAVAGAGTRLLVDLTRAAGGEAYLTGDGAAGYLEPGLFEASGIELVEQRYAWPRYPQPVEEFVPGLSFLDAVANVGIAAARDLVVGAAA